MSVQHWGWGFILLTISVIALTWQPTLSRAHPVGNFSINHYSRLRVETGSIDLRYILDIAEIPTFQTIQEHHLVADVAHPSAQAYVTQAAETLKDGLILQLNGQRLTLQVVDRDIMFPHGAGKLPTLKLGFVYRANLPQELTLTDGQLRYQDTNFPGRTGWKEIIAVSGPGVRLTQSSVPTTDRSRELTDYPTDLSQSAPQVLEAQVNLQFTGQLRPARQASAATGTALQANQQALSSLALTHLMPPGNLSLSMMLLALSVAMGLGAFHALEPGHGKTVVAAYLVGSRGTARHALWLGIIVTVTHTAGVYLLGGITLYASQYIVPEQLYPWLGVISGVIITVLGIYLFLQRYTGEANSHGHHHGHHHHGHHPIAAHPRSHDLVAKPVHRHAQTVAVMDAIQQDQNIDYQIYRSATHGHEPHDHHGHQHHLPEDTVTFRQLFMLGVTGGIVPCPAALVVLLSAVAMHRVGFGLLLIVAFSVGLAVVLIAIGLLMVYARQFMSRFQGEGRLMTRWLPLASAALITVFGIGMIVKVLMQNGILTISL